MCLDVYDFPLLLVILLTKQLQRFLIAIPKERSEKMKKVPLQSQKCFYQECP